MLCCCWYVISYVGLDGCRFWFWNGFFDVVMGFRFFFCFLFLCGLIGIVSFVLCYWVFGFVWFGVWYFWWYLVFWVVFVWCSVCVDCLIVCCFFGKWLWLRLLGYYCVSCDVYWWRFLFDWIGLGILFFDVCVCLVMFWLCLVWRWLYLLGLCNGIIYLYCWFRYRCNVCCWFDLFCIVGVWVCWSGLVFGGRYFCVFLLLLR